MKFLLTNDDGVEARGLQALADAVDGLGDVVVVAPSAGVSGCSHSVTTERPFRVAELAPGRWAVEGTPTDCVRVALHRFSPQVEWVLAGINSGGNLGVDVYHSGTVAAVREAALRGLPAIAVSHYRNRVLTEADWKRAAEWTKPVLAELLRRPRTPGVFWNVNLPSLEPGAGSPGIIYCPLDPSPLPLSFEIEEDLLHYNGRYGSRPRRAGSDVDVCFGGKIAVTEISVMEASR